MAYEVLHSAGTDPIEANKIYTIYMYPNTSQEITVCEEAILSGPPGDDHNGGLIHLCDQMKTNGDVDYYEICRYTGVKPDIELDDDDYDDVGNPGFYRRVDFKEEFDDWFEGKYDGYKGTHICIATEFGGGMANSPSSPSQTTAFTDSKTAIASVRGSSEERWASIAVHECMHTIIITYLSEVEDLIDTEEHELGDLHQAGPDEWVPSPMLGNYGSEIATAGTCDKGNELKSGRWTKLNSCEQEAIEATSNHEYN